MCRGGSFGAHAVGVASYLTALLPGAHAAGGAPVDTSNVDRIALSASVLMVSTFLVALGLGFEKMKHYLIHVTPWHTRPIVDSLFAELTLLGAIGLLFFAIEQAGLLYWLSGIVFGEGHEGELTHVFHEVHMVLFLVMVCFLVGILLLVWRSTRMASRWREMEGESVVLKPLEDRYHAAYATASAAGGGDLSSPRDWLAMRCHCCSRRGALLQHLADARRTLLYAVMRNRFVRPPPDVAVSTAPAAATDWEKAPNNQHYIRLGDGGAGWVYTKRERVFAFHTNDHLVVRSAGADGAATGDIEEEAGRSDYIVVHEDAPDRLMCMKAADFEATYVQEAGAPHCFKSKEVVLALLMNGPFYARVKPHEAVRGRAGQFLVQEKDMSQHVLSAEEFSKRYELADGDQIRDASRDLPEDFDFAQYLNARLGNSVAEIVEVGGWSWVTMEVVMVIVWGIMVAVETDVVAVLLPILGFGIVAVELAVTLRLRKIVAQLVPERLQHTRVPDAFELRSSSDRSLQTGQGAARIVHDTSNRSLLNGSVQARLLQGAVSDASGTAASGDDAAQLTDSGKVFSRPMRATGRERLPSDVDEVELLEEGPSERKAPEKLDVSLSPKEAKPGPESKQPHSPAPSAPGSNSIRVVSAYAIDSPSLRKPLTMESGTNMVNDVSELRSRVVTNGFGHPPFLLASISTKVREPPCCLKPFLHSHRAATRHERLFWLGAHGPHAIIHVIRIGVLSIALFTAVMSFLTSGTCSTDASLCTVSFILVTLPAVLSIIILPYTISYLVFATSIEQLRKPATVLDVVRAQKTARSLRALRMLSAMKIKARSNIRMSQRVIAEADSESGSESKGGAEDDATRLFGKPGQLVGAARRMYGLPDSAPYQRKRRELLEVFSCFDKGKDGKVGLDDMIGILEMLGFGDTAEEHAAEVMAEVDRDGSGELEFDEWFNWMALQEESAGDTEGLARAVFDIIDKDGSGEISGDELRHSLSTVGEVMTSDDITRIVAEFDHDGSGSISFHEFDDTFARLVADTQFGSV